MRTNALRTFALCLAMTTPVVFAQAAGTAGTAQATAEAPHNWTTEDIVTASVSDAWQLSGKNEANFFDIVQQLAQISAEKRGLVLPDDPAAGRRMGQYIKAHAKADHHQLLYVIVDKAVQLVGKPASGDTAAQ